MFHKTTFKQIFVYWTNYKTEISKKNFLPGLKILQESCKFLNSGKFICLFLVAKANWKLSEMTDISIFDQQSWT